MRKKMKSHRGAAKRFIKTGSGKVLRKLAGKRHLLVHKSSRRRRGMDQRATLHSADARVVKRLLPYMS